MASSNINKRLLGLPLGFTKLADPNFRVFNKLFVRGATVVTVIPGLPKFVNGNEVSAKYEELRKSVLEDSDMEGMWNDQSNVTVGFNKDYAIEEADGHGNSYERDRRYYAFKQAMYEYRKTVNVLLNEVGAKVAGYALGSRLESFVDASVSDYYGLNFYAESSTTVSESASNSLGDSMLAGGVKGVSENMREMAFLAGKTENAAFGQVQAEQAEARLAGQEQTGLAAMLTAAQGVVRGVVGNNVSANAGAAISGENVLYPKVWKDSTFDKSYNLSFKFASPYGDPESIFEYVYVPFLLLLGLALPRQTTPNAYKSPFLIRLACPGYFNCDMGMITNFTFVRGGSEGLWNENGLPMMIDVTMSVTDLYPTLMCSTNIALLRNNIGLSGFLDTMCGLAAMNANIRANIRGSIASKVSMFLGAPTTAASAANEMISRAMTAVLVE